MSYLTRNKQIPWKFRRNNSNNQTTYWSPLLVISLAYPKIFPLYPYLWWLIPHIFTATWPRRHRRRGTLSPFPGVTCRAAGAGVGCAELRMWPGFLRIFHCQIWLPEGTRRDIFGMYIYWIYIYNIYIYIIFIHYQMYSTKYPGYRVQGEIIRDGRIFVFPSPVVRSNSLQTLWSDHSAGINLIPNIHTALKETGSFSAIIKTYLQ
jgi:hypothetical protein